MGESFKKIKNKALLAAVVKSVTVGLSSGLFIAGILLIIFALCNVGFHWALYLAIGLGVAAVSGGLCFFLMRPTDKKVAKKYDKEYGFNEKLQTMIEFSGSGAEGDIITLQRQDALDKLANAPALKVKFSRIWYYIVIAVLSLALAASGIALVIIRNYSAADPVIPPPDIGDVGKDPPDDPVADGDKFEYTLVMQGDMDDLINSVRGADLDDDIRAYMVDRLEELDKTLIEVKLKSVMLEEVYIAVSDIDGMILATNSFLTLSDEITEADVNLANAITKGVISYKGRIMDNMPERYVYALRADIGDYIESAMEDFIAESVGTIKVKQYPVDGSKDLVNTLTEYIASVDGVLTASLISDTDALYGCFKTLTGSLKSIRNQASATGTADSILWGRMDDVYGTFTKNAVSALSVQSFKCIIEVFVRQRLADILDISFDGIEELYNEVAYTPDEGNNGGGSGDGSSGGNNGGGSGEGDVKYGSDDLIYYPATGEYVKFGDVLKEYEAAITNGTLAEDFPQDLAKYLEAYLNYLHNGTGNKD